jgi:hypothetical protein
MKVEFRVNGYGNLIAEAGQERDILVTTKFMQARNKEQAISYLREIAAEMTEIYATDPEAAEALLIEAEGKVHAAQLAEKFMEEVRF